MPRVENRIVWNFRQFLSEALVHGLWIRTGKIHSAATIEEEGVAGHQTAIDEKTLTTRRVAGCVNELNVDRPDADHVATRVSREGVCGQAGHFADVVGLIGLNVYRYVDPVEQLGNSLEVESHHRATDVVGVVVGGQYAAEPHVVGFEDVEMIVDGVGRIDEYGLTGLAVADRVDEIDHLPGDLIINREVTSGQQLAEVEAIWHPSNLDAREDERGGAPHGICNTCCVPDWVTGGMVPPPELLPDVLPSKRLTASGVPVRELRNELRRIPVARNALTTLSVWTQIIGEIWLAIWLSNPFAWAVVFILMGRNFANMAILGHEASHRILFPNRRLNDFVGRWLAFYPNFTAFDIYRRLHMAHHREEFGPTEPDMNFYSGFPVGWPSMRRKFTRDIFGVTGARNLISFFKAFGSNQGRPVAARILVSQLIILATFTAIGRPELYLLIWLLPWITVWKLLNRLRSIAEHGGLHRSTDRRETTHHVHQTLVPRFWFAPFNTGWHLAHHVDPGVPFRNLPTLQVELESAGYVIPEFTWPSYTALWRSLATGRAAGRTSEQQSE